jgi:hypothetical protein
VKEERKREREKEREGGKEGGKKRKEGKKEGQDIHFCRKEFINCKSNKNYIICKKMKLLCKKSQTPLEK